MVPVAVASTTRVRVIRLSGEIDASTVDLLVHAIEPHLDLTQGTIIVDLRALVRAERHANRMGSTLCLVSGTTAVKRSLAVLDMLRG